MKKRDKRVRKFKEQRLNEDITPPSPLFILALTLEDEYRGLPLEEASALYMENAKTEKLVHLMHAYDINSERIPDPTLRLFSLAMKLSEEFVRGFKFVNHGEQIKAPHRPKEIKLADWEHLIREVIKGQEKGQSINRVCQRLVASHPAFRRQTPLSLAAQYRRKMREIEKPPISVKARDEIALLLELLGK